MSCQSRPMSLSYPWVYYRSSSLLGGQPTKANKLHPPGVRQVILRQVPAVALSFLLLSRGYHVEVEVGQAKDFVDDAQEAHSAIHHPCMAG